MDGREKYLFEHFYCSYYHSIFDDTASVNYVYANKSEVPNDSIQAYLANVSTALAHSLYEHVMNKEYLGSLTADKNLVSVPC